MEDPKIKVDYEDTNHCCEDVLELFEHREGSDSLTKFFGHSTTDYSVVADLRDSQKHRSLHRLVAFLGLNLLRKPDKGVGGNK